MSSQAEIRKRIREIIRLRNPGVIVPQREGMPGRVEPVAEGGFLPLLPLLATTLAPAVGSLVKYGVDKLTGNALYRAPPKAKRPTNGWTSFVSWYHKTYSNKDNKMTWKDALKLASPHWKTPNDKVVKLWERKEVVMKEPQGEKIYKFSDEEERAHLDKRRAERGLPPISAVKQARELVKMEKQKQKERAKQEREIAKNMKQAEKLKREIRKMRGSAMSFYQ